MTDKTSLENSLTPSTSLSAPSTISSTKEREQVLQRLRNEVESKKLNRLFVEAKEGTISASLREKIQGPTNWSHWVIPGRLIAGAYPGERTEKEHEELLETLVLGAKVTTFVNLLEIPESKRFTPYPETIEKIKKANDLKTEFQHISFPIPDQSIHSKNEEVVKLVWDIIRLIDDGECVYVHCWGGHGRTGTVVSILIGLLFNVSAQTALDVNKKLHSCRIKTNGQVSPQTRTQFDQVRAVSVHPDDLRDKEL